MRDNINEFMRRMNSLNEKEYMYNLIAYGIAPTVCGYKASTLINLSSKYKNTYKLWKENKEEFLDRVPLKHFELKRTNDSYSILFYDEDKLNETLKKKNCTKFLNNFGYKEKDSLINFLHVLKARYKEGCPHEVGLFLDIPLDDVLGFIKNDGKNYLYCGYWKVYSNVDGAMKTFKNYDWSKKEVINLIAGGKNAFQVFKLLEEYKFIAVCN
ncbi:DUF3793 family protein [Clostridium swellfunianum]|uniref:DUF3793 family protein n=1 Tax=Clostridium swellfunianum TaxID=1367462 RepID=UPI00202E756B|nr:DUF3793 family protein [Clostridium swellfunianum]MCM0648531.1 DUF3793 family protein [Clostridium swellfunianum]